MPDYAILNADETIREVRSFAEILAPDQIKHVDGKPLARPIRDVFPANAAGFALGASTLTVHDTEVVRTWALRWLDGDDIDRTWDGGHTWR